MRFILTCDCGSDNFEWDGNTEEFTCITCGDVYSADRAGHELLGEEESI